MYIFLLFVTVFFFQNFLVLGVLPNILMQSVPPTKNVVNYCPRYWKKVSSTSLTKFALFFTLPFLVLLWGSSINALPVVMDFMTTELNPYYQKV